MKRSNARSYRERAAIYTRLAEEAVSDEAKAMLVYLEEMWLAAAEVADAVEANKWRHPLDDIHRLSPE
jgi:hypothetical protein